jgi:hypothetical protein
MSSSATPDVNPYEICAMHDRHEPSLPGDYKVCGECLHVWRTEADFVRDALAEYELHAQASLKYYGKDIGPYQGDPRQQPFCPLCTHDF